MYLEGEFTQKTHARRPDIHLNTRPAGGPRRDARPTFNANIDLALLSPTLLIQKQRIRSSTTLPTMINRNPGYSNHEPMKLLHNRAPKLPRINHGERGGGGGLCLVDTLRVPFPPHFWNPSGARTVPFLEFFSVLSGRSPVVRERAPHHDHERGRGRLATCESRRSSVWNSLSFLLCVHLVRALFTLAQKNLQMKVHWLPMTPFLVYTSRRQAIMLTVLFSLP